MAKSHHYTKLLALLITLAMVHQAASARKYAAPTATVSIVNILEGQETLQVRCNSVGRNFGASSVPYGKTYDLTFYAVSEAYEINCEFVFNGVSHSFDIYSGSRDKAGCGDNGRCKWVIKKDPGPCSVDGTVKCYPWN